MRLIGDKIAEMPNCGPSGDRVNCYAPFLLALAVRLLVLMLIFVLGPDVSGGFIANSVEYDDVRYESGAQYYAENASSLFDLNEFQVAYAQYGDRTGYQTDEIFTRGSLWYYIVCFVVYFTQGTLVVRLLTVFANAATTIFIYKIAYRLSGYRAAVVAAFVYALLPYPITFACFAYKDNLVILLITYLVYTAISVRHGQRFDMARLLVCAISSVLLLGLRSGFGAIVICMCLLVAVAPKTLKECQENIYIVAPIFAALAISVIAILANWGVFEHKISAYLELSNKVDGPLSLFAISSLNELYKLPVSYFYAMLLPIGGNESISSCFDLICSMVYLNVPIATGAFLFLFTRRKADPLSCWAMAALFFITVITSITVFRHFFSLLPVSVIFFAIYIVKMRTRDWLLFLPIVYLASAALFLYFG